MSQPRPDPAFPERGGSELNPNVVRRELSGAVIGTPKAQMVTACIGTGGSAACVAIEHFAGMAGGNPGTFMTSAQRPHEKGPPKFSVAIFPCSDTGEPTGISGTPKIDSTDGKRSCALSYKEP